MGKVIYYNLTTEENSMDHEDLSCLPEGSVCEACVYCIARIVEPLDDEAFEVYAPGDDDEDSVFIHTCCILLDIGLHDHVVRACSKFKENTGNILMENKFLRIT